MNIRVAATYQSIKTGSEMEASGVSETDRMRNADKDTGTIDRKTSRRRLQNKSK
jgi:hypothetical protein